MSELWVSRIQRFSTHDGPGIRTTVFLQGCPMACAWCHNPETRPLRPVLLWDEGDCVECGACASVCPTGSRTVTAEGTLVYRRETCTACGACAIACPTGGCTLSGKLMTVEEILAVILRDKAFYGTHGGVTLSGGEPLLQAEVMELIRACREEGIHVAVETAGGVAPARMAEAAALCDLMLYDIKDTDATRHQAMTGVDNDLILRNLYECDRVMTARGEGRIRLRCIVVKGVNTIMTHWQAVAEIYHRLSRCEGVELIPYHAYAGNKAAAIGLENNARADWIPHKEELQMAQQALISRGVHVFAPI